MVLCDTCVLLFDALEPERIPGRARELMEEASDEGSLVAADISLWEIAMLIDKGRVKVPVSVADFLTNLLALRALRVLPITVDIATRSAGLGLHGDPADRLIAATAIEHKAVLLTADQKLATFPGLDVVWR